MRPEIGWYGYFCFQQHGLWKDAKDVEKDMADAEMIVSRPASPHPSMVTHIT